MKQVPPCGFCQNGQIRTGERRMLARHPHSDARSSVESMNGTYAGAEYYRVQTAIKRAAKAVADASPARERRSLHERLWQDSEQIERSLRRIAGLPQERGTARVSFGGIRGGPGRRESDAQSSVRLRTRSVWPDPDFRQIRHGIVLPENNTGNVLCRGKTDLGPKAREQVSAS